MSNRRSRTSRSRKNRSSELPQQDVAVARAPAADPVAEMASAVDPTETAQLRALEAGWDELLS